MLRNKTKYLLHMVVFRKHSNTEQQHHHHSNSHGTVQSEEVHRAADPGCEAHPYRSQTLLKFYNGPRSQQNIKSTLCSFLVSDSSFPPSQSVKMYPWRREMRRQWLLANFSPKIPAPRGLFILCRSYGFCHHYATLSL